MWLEAILTKDDLSALVTELCPLTIALGDGTDVDQYLKLFNPKDVALVAERGLRVTCEAELRWPVLGVDVPVRADSLTVVLSLGVVPGESGETLAFKPELEHMDLSWVPNVFDVALSDKVNQELSRKHIELSWRFSETLSRVVPLPVTLSPVTALDVKVAWGKVRITEEAMVLAVSFHTRVLRHDVASELPSAPLAGGIGASAPAPPLTLAKSPGVTVSVPVAIAGAAALGGVAAVVAFGATSSLLRLVFGRA